MNMDFCPYCQRWVEPVKGTNDLLGGLFFGLPGVIVGGAHYALKGSRCPICNSVIKRAGARPIVTPYPPIGQQPQYHYPTQQPPLTPPGLSGPVYWTTTEMPLLRVGFGLDIRHWTMVLLQLPIPSLSQKTSHATTLEQLMHLPVDLASETLS